MKPQLLSETLEAMWRDYLRINPQADRIYQLFSQYNEQIDNDHIALRTFDLEDVCIEQLALPFIKAGYEFQDEYQFPEKHLYARYYLHPDPHLPKIFISEFLTEYLSAENQLLVHNLIAEIEPEQIHQDNFCYSGRHWELSYEDYLALLAESEYAAWVAAFGFRPNHFTILVNTLDSHDDLAEINLFLKQHGFPLNQAGGEIKGGEDCYLAQSSTLAGKIKVQFSDQIQEIPGCYYEFAQRFTLPDGQLYQGFVAASADKIFQSTDTR